MRLIVGTDQIVEIPNLTDDQGNPVFSATVSARVIDRDGVGISGPVTLDHKGDGRYSGQLDNGDGLNPRHRYILEVTAEYSEAVRVWRQSLVAEYGRF